MEEESTSSDIGICGKTQLDSWDSRMCKDFFTSGCEQGDNCSLKHTSYIREIVCRFFLIHGKCQKGAQCPFIHSLVSEKLPHCKNQSGNSKCTNPQCKFKHSDKEIKECIYYNLGFCQMGKFCKFKHEGKDLCRNNKEQGFCSENNCSMYHIQDSEDLTRTSRIFEEYLEEAYYRLHKDAEKIRYEDVYQLCFRCMQFGHHPSKCENPDKVRVIRCYKCMKYGHKSNNCMQTQIEHN